MGRPVEGERMEMIKPLQLGDMTIVPEKELPPLKLIKAAAVIAIDLHPTFAAANWLIHPEKSKTSCILASLTVRDFLWRLGFLTARVRPVMFYIEAWQHQKSLHSLGIGAPNLPADGEGWDGHMIVEVNGWLIDTTLYQVNRPQWDWLPGQLMLPMGPKRIDVTWNLPLLVGYEVMDENDYKCVIAWLDRSDNKGWEGAPDTEKERRKPVVQALTERFKLVNADVKKFFT